MENYQSQSQPRTKKTIKTKRTKKVTERTFWEAVVLLILIGGGTIFIMYLQNDQLKKELDERAVYSPYIEDICEELSPTVISPEEDLSK